MGDDRDALERHRVAFELPDLITSFPTGTLTLDDERIVWEFVADACAQTDRFYWLSDISRIERYATGSIDLYTNTDQGVLVQKVLNKLVGIAIVGGNFQQRTIMSVVFRAGRLLGAMRPTMEVKFFRDESSARAWIGSLREKPAVT